MNHFLIAPERLFSVTSPVMIFYVARDGAEIGQFSEKEFRGVMSGVFLARTREAKRIRREKPVIKGGIFPSNSR